MTSRTVWLASYPKSGNTWVRAMLAALDHGEVGLNTTIRGSTMASARGPLERLTGLVSSELLADEVIRLRPMVDASLDDRFAATSLALWPRKIHDALYAPADGPPIVSLEATRAAIYLLRDPRDVAVSFAHHLGREIEHAVAVMGSGLAYGGVTTGVTRQFPQHMGTWSTHVEGWIDHQLFPVEVIRYEDMLADPVGQLRKIALRLEREASLEELEAAVEAAGFDKLKSQEAESGFREAMARDRPFFRRGMAGAWRDELSPELAARIVADHGPVMERFGYLESGDIDPGAEHLGVSAPS